MLWDKDTSVNLGRVPCPCEQRVFAGDVLGPETWPMLKALCSAANHGD